MIARHFLAAARSDQIFLTDHRVLAWTGKAPKCSVYGLSHEDRHRENFLDAASWLLAGIPDCYDDAIRF